MEVTTLNTTGAAGLRGPTPLLRLQSDERLVALTRKGNQAAYEALVARYQSRLLAFCRHMLGSKEDAEDVLQEVFAASYSALMADDRAINVRPWFYRIARNRSLNHLRRKSAVGVDSMDIHLADHGTTTADRVHQREEFRLLMGDVQELAETQRTALLLREIDNLSYDQIAEAMDTTVSSIKSLLVRARVSLAEASEARAMSCEDVRAELGEVAEGLAKLSPQVRRHCRQCERCGAFRDHLKQTNKALALALPVAPFLLIKKLVLAHLGTTASAGTASAAVAATATSAGTAGAGGFLSASVATIASKTAAGLAAAAIVTAGAVEVDRAQNAPSQRGEPVAQAIAPVKPVPQAPAEPVAVASVAQPTVADTKDLAAATAEREAKSRAAGDEPAATTPTETTPAEPTPTTPTTPTETTPAATPPPATTTTETGGDTTVLPPTVITDHTGGTVPTDSSAPPVAPVTTPAPPVTAGQPAAPAPAPPAEAPTATVTAPPVDVTVTAPTAPTAPAPDPAAPGTKP